LHQVAFVKGLDQKQEQKSGFKKKEKERGMIYMEFIAACNAFCTCIMIKKTLHV
jgi:hypothetical protein